MLKLEYKGDSLVTEDNQQVMMAWEQQLMDISIEHLAPTGNVLEIGFGMAYSATQIQQYEITSHTIIECNETVFEKAKSWREKMLKLNPNRTITLVFGTWQNKIHELGKFDAVFMDDFPLLKNKTNNCYECLDNSLKLNLFFDLVVKNHLEINGKISSYLNKTCDKWNVSSDIEPFVEVVVNTINVEIPKHCTYRDVNDQHATIPIVTLLRPYDFDIVAEKQHKITNLKKVK
jgi:hypothetical protein